MTERPLPPRRLDTHRREYIPHEILNVEWGSYETHTIPMVSTAYIGPFQVHKALAINSSPETDEEKEERYKPMTAEQVIEFLKRTRDKYCKEWMQTFSGQQFFPFHPDPERILLEDIAHHLAAINRYTGATRVPYSVGHHSVLVALYIIRYQSDPHLALKGLLHDGSEAYTNDVIRPLKHTMGGFKALEDNLQWMVYTKFGINPTYREEELKAADNALLEAERRDLMAPPPRPWSWHSDLPWPEAIRPVPHHIAKHAFQETYAGLKWVTAPAVGEAEGCRRLSQVYEAIHLLIHEERRAPAYLPWRHS